MKPLSPGQTFDCQFIIRQHLGSGKHKSAYLADAILHHKNIWSGKYTETKYPVVLKLFETTEEIEGKIQLKTLNTTKNIASIYKIHFLNSPKYLVEEYLSGTTLDKVEPPQINAVGRGAGAISKAHSATLIHNDLHPGNIFVCGGRVKVTDFGNSLLLGKTHPADHCKTKYRAPETFDGEPVQASDVWSLGVILYEQLAGVRPFEQDRPNMQSEDYQRHMREKILLEKPVPLRERAPGIPRSIESLVNATLRKDPFARPTAQEMYRTLRWRIF